MGDTIKQLDETDGSPDMAARIEQEQAAYDQAVRKVNQETQMRQAVAEREAQEARLDKLSRERLEAERKAQISLDARIEAERKLAIQLQARMEREKRADGLAEQNAKQEEQLRQAVAERKAQERRLQAERLAARNAARAVAASASPVAAIYAKYFDFPKRYYWIAAALFAAAGSYYAWHLYRAGMPADLARDRAMALQAGTPVADGLSLKLSPELGAAGGPLPAPAKPLTPAEEKAAKEEKAWAFRAGAVREQLKVGAYADIVRSAQALTHDFPDRWEGWFWLGSAQFALGRTAAAETALEYAAKLNPGEVQVWMQRAILAREHNDHAAAIRLLTEARALSPGMPQIYLNLGYSNDALGQFAEAEKNYRTFLALTEGSGAYTSQRQSVIDRLGKGKR